MATITRMKFSASTDGKNVKVVQTATAGTLIHTAHVTSTDFIYLDATNTDSVDRLVTVEFGGVASPDDLVEYTVPAQDGPHRIISGWSLTNGLLVRVFAAAANVVNINGFVQRQS